MKITGTNKRAGAVLATAAAVLATAPIAQARGGVFPGQNAPSAEIDPGHAALLVKDRPLSVVPDRPARPVDGQAPLVRAQSDIDWSDTGAGAGVAFGLVLLAGGGVLVTRRLVRA